MKNKPLIESITEVESTENKMKIIIYREEATKDFDHNLNMKVYRDIIAKEHKTTYDLCLALLKIHRVYEVTIKNSLGHGIRLIKNEE
jgi:hypothetical protein